MKLHIDVETYSSENIKTSGAYRYLESVDFEILLCAYAFDDEPIQIIDRAKGEPFPPEFIEALLDPAVEKHAHNANFERQVFKTIGYDIPIDQWHCTMIKAAYCGLPLSLDMVSKVLKLGSKGKKSTGKALIKYFCGPCKPTKVNGGKYRNAPSDAPDKWEEFKDYCIWDVEAERAIYHKLSKYELPEFEVNNYIVDQQINDRGIQVDLDFAEKAIEIDDLNSKIIYEQMKEITGIENPNSPKQIKDWLSDEMGREVKSLAKGELPDLIEEAETKEVEQVINLRGRSSKTSTKKYVAMVNCACSDDRVRGMFQFYGANRTGRWGGRLVQLQNLPQNHLKNLNLARDLVKKNGFEDLALCYGNVASTLSQLIRTAFVAKEGHTLVVADFSAIEARVIAWLANEKWRLDVFKSHGKIYEASASMMFDVPIEEITKGSDLRFKGKVAELALGFGGSVGAMSQMGAGDMGLSVPEIKEIVTRWRQKSPAIVRLWRNLESCAMKAVKTRRVIESKRGITFFYDGDFLQIKLPSGRSLFYASPSFTENEWGYPALQYKGMGVGRNWITLDTYGGKLSENLVQAIARDVLAFSIQKLNKQGFKIIMHVHDEAVAEVPEELAEQKLKQMCDIMGQPIDWAPGLPNKAEGYITPFYKKD